ncbi:MAG TPA: glutathione S-transferase family protein [Byssovorax sp.]|jgi:glutathione S-transferase
MIKLHKFGPAFGLPDASPFVMKVETYLRLTEQPYEVVTGDVRKAPRKQLPVVEIDGERVPDSSAIVERLEAKRGHKLDAHLDAKQRAVGLAFKSMLEEHLYFCVLYFRWQEDDGWVVFEPTLRELLAAGGVPGFLRGIIAKSARKQVIGRVKTQGVGRKPRAEVVADATHILDALSDHMGDSPWFAGAEPSSYDATVYAFVAGALCPAFANEMHAHAAKKANLVAYAERVRSKYWKS